MDGGEWARTGSSGAGGVEWTWTGWSGGGYGGVRSDGTKLGLNEVPTETEMSADYHWGLSVHCYIVDRYYD